MRFNRAMFYCGMVGLGASAGHYVHKKFDFGVKIYDVPRDLKKYVIIITGADKGIGKAAVEQLAPTGARIIMACKDIDNCKVVRRQIVVDSKNRHVVCRQCDLSSFESVKKFAAKMIKEEPKIDVLINNAAVKYVKPRRLSRENIERHLAVNFLGPHLLTMLLLDKMKESGTGRVVNVLCGAYKKGKIDFNNLNFDQNYHPATAYEQSKLALALCTKELAKELASSGITVNGVNPDYTCTELERSTSMDYFGFLRHLFYVVTRREPRQGAYPPLYAALSLEMNGVSGKLVTPDLEQQHFDETLTGDPVLQRKLWLTAQKWTQLSEAKKEVADMVANASYSQNSDTNKAALSEAAKKEATTVSLPQDSAQNPTLNQL